MKKEKKRGKEGNKEQQRRGKMGKKGKKKIGTRERKRNIQDYLIMKTASMNFKLKEIKLEQPR